MERWRRAHGFELLLVTIIGACAPSEHQDPLRSRSAQTRVVLQADWPNAGLWLDVGLHETSLSGIDVAHPLELPQGLAEDSPLLIDPESRAVVQYLVECALGSDQSVAKVVDGQTLTFDGALGLAPQWEDEACDEDCQQWVSACLLARSNATDAAVEVILYGDHPALDGYHPSMLSKHEASWFGNLFVEPEVQYLCEGKIPADRDGVAVGRACSTDVPEDCGFTNVGSCYAGARCLALGPAPHRLIDCAAQEPDSGLRYRTVSTYVY